MQMLSLIFAEVQEVKPNMCITIPRKSFKPRHIQDKFNNSCPVSERESKLLFNIERHIGLIQREQDCTGWTLLSPNASNLLKF